MATLVAAVLSPALAPAQGPQEVVLVTAERRAQNLNEVPIAATVFSGEEMVNKGIDRIHDVQQFVPNVAIHTYNRSTFFNIRGVGLAVSAPAAQPGVAYYIDGLFIAKEQLVAHTFFDLESMEVLRGPQGTLTGQNSTGGAVYARSAAPDFDSTGGYIDQTIGDYDWYRTTGAFNTPLGDKAALRIAGVYEDRGSYTDNIGPSGSEPGSGAFLGARIKLALRPTDLVSLNLGLDYFDNDTDYNAVKNRNDLVTSDPFVIQEDGITYRKQDGFRASAELIVDTEADIQFRWISSIQQADQEDQADGDRTATALPVPEGEPASGSNRAMYPGRISQAYNEFDYVTTEFNILSTGDSALQWVAGAFYLEEEIPTELYRDNYHTVDFVESNSDIVTSSDASSTAVFGQINYRFSDSFEFIAGARRSEDDFELTRYALPGPPPPGGFPNISSTSSTETTGRVGLNFFANDDVMFYGTFSKGYKPGAVNLTPGYADYEPEQNEVLEFGMKSTWMDGRLGFNTALFSSDIKNFHLLSLLSVGGGPPLPTFQNGTKGKSEGVEFELTYTSARDLMVNAAIGYLSAEFAQDNILNDAIAGGNELVSKGSPMPFAPDLTASFGIQRTFDVGGKQLTPRFQVAYIDDQLATPFLHTETFVPSHTVADLRLRYEPSDQLRLEGFINNVFDETYIAAQIQDASSADGGLLYGAPRHFGVRLSYYMD
jgi:iron complex outermembrane receptor protein